MYFVYNANSGIWNNYIDTIHKIVSPSTYSCDLCTLTHGNFSEKGIWKDFRKKSSFKCVFMYKDEFLNAYSKSGCENLKFPVILQKQEEKFLMFLDSEKLASLGSITELIEFIGENEV